MPSSTPELPSSLTVNNHIAAINHISWAPEDPNLVLTCANDRTVKVFDTRTTTAKARYEVTFPFTVPVKAQWFRSGESLAILDNLGTYEQCYVYAYTRVVVALMCECGIIGTIACNYATSSSFHSSCMPLCLYVSISMYSSIYVSISLSVGCMKYYGLRNNRTFHDITFSQVRIYIYR